MIKTVRVRISNHGRVPFVGKGPINSVWISESEYETLKKLGYNIVVLERALTIDKSSSSIKKVQPVEEIMVEEVIEETIEEEEIIEEHEEVVEEVVEETSEEVEEEELLVNDEELSADAYYEFEFLTKKKAISILENRGVEFDKDSTAEVLKNLVVETNPEVE